MIGLAGFDRSRAGTSTHLDCLITHTRKADGSAMIARDDDQDDDADPDSSDRVIELGPLGSGESDDNDQNYVASPASPSHRSHRTRVRRVSYLTTAILVLGAVAIIPAVATWPNAVSMPDEKSTIGPVPVFTLDGPATPFPSSTVTPHVLPTR
jgi:hypothetical protein